MEYLGAWGTLIHEKKLRSKISCQTPFKNHRVMENSQRRMVAMLQLVLLLMWVGYIARPRGGLKLDLGDN
jgi:hypothetical protein